MKEENKKEKTKNKNNPKREKQKNTSIKREWEGETSRKRGRLRLKISLEELGNKRSFSQKKKKGKRLFFKVYIQSTNFLGQSSGKFSYRALSWFL